MALFPAVRGRGGPRWAAAWVLLLLTGCGESPLVDESVGSARLSARPAAGEPPFARKGVLPLPLAGGEASRGVLFVPEAYQPGTPAPLVVLLHGAGGSGEGILPLVRARAEARGALVLAPDAAAGTWDLVKRRQYGPDVRFLDETLGEVFRQYTVDPGRIGISGFSDGASYALSLGLTNGDLFWRIAAFSPGAVAASELQGEPGVFVSHGTKDRVLPIDVSSRYLVPRLQDADYAVVYREFDGPHTVPEDLAAEGFSFLVGDSSPP